MKHFSTILIVEDDAALARTIQAALAGLAEVHLCQRAAEAVALLAELHPNLLLLDVALPDGSAFDVLAALTSIEPAPMVVAMSGSTRPGESFRLAQLGVSAYLTKPFTLQELQAAIDRARTTPADLRPHLRALVGLRPIHDVEDEIRQTMLNEALARAGGSRRGAARLLAVSRQLLQHMLRKLQG